MPLSRLGAFFRRLAPARTSPVRHVFAVVGFLLAWALLNTVVNLRTPARVEEPHPWWLLPSVDVVALLAIFAALGWRGRYLPLPGLIFLAVLALMVRLLRLADGIIQQNYFRSLNLSLDLPLFPELCRLMYTTIPLPWLVLWVLVALATIGVFLLLVVVALDRAQRFLGAGHWQRAVFVGLTGLFLALHPLWPQGGPSPDAWLHDTIHQGLFGNSVIPDFTHQARLARAAVNMRQIKAREIQNVQSRLARLPSGLERLKRADVLFFLVESYGSTVFRKPEHFARIRSLLDGFSTSLAKDGYQVSSSWLDSSTFGGASWLAHGTLASGVRIEDGLHFALLRQTEKLPNTMAAFFERGGYRTVLVQPGTTRRFPEGEVRGFTAKYYAPDLDYQGPRFGWAPMPDQYVIDFIHRKEVAVAKQPLFILYTLVSSHAPWAVQPQLIDDWEDIGRGRIYQGLEPYYYDISWTNLHEASDPYMDSLIYDFEVIKRYIEKFVKRDSFIILLGDHQPAAVGGDDQSRTVPIHIISKDPAVTARFAEAGYVPGFIPPSTGAEVLGMERFLEQLVERLSGKD